MPCLKRIETSPPSGSIFALIRIAIKTCLKRIEDSSLRNWQIISDVLAQIYRPIELVAKIRMKQTKGCDYVHLKLKM